MMSKDPVIWLNGESLPASRATLSPFDQGLLLGDGVFETLRAYSGEPFAVAEHCERLAHAATVFGFLVPDRDTLEGAMQEVLRANQLLSHKEDARIRITVTGGSKQSGVMTAPECPTVMVTAEPIASINPTASVLVVPFTRNPRSATAGIKTTSYAENSLALRYVRQRRYDEAIMADTEGHLCEAATSNVFILLEGRLLTPPLSTGCLPGVTRGLVLAAARRKGIEVLEEKVAVTALERSEGAFLTSSLRELQPVVRVGETDIPTCADLCANLAIR